MDVVGHVLDRVEHAAGGVQVVELLAQPANPRGLALDPLACRQRVFPGQRAQQRGLAGAVDTHQADALARGQPPGEVIDQGAAVGSVDARVLQLHDDLALALLGKGHELDLVARGGHVRDQRLGGLDAVARLGGTGWCATTQPRELLARQVLAALLDRIRLAGTLGAREGPVVVAALVDVHRTVVNLPGQRGDCVQEPAVVGDHHHCYLARQQVLGKPLDALDVQVVRRFVQHHQVQILHQRRSDIDPAPLAAGEVAHLGVQAEVCNAGALQHLAHLGIRRPLVSLQT